MLIIYGALTVTGILAVWLISGEGLMAINHVLAAVLTGGFSAFENNLADIDGWYS